MKKINVALIGHGYWGSKLLKYLEINPNFEVKHICDSKTDMSKIWNDVVAVVIATPTNTHYKIAKEALLHNKYVLCEKPLALKWDECLDLQLSEYGWGCNKKHLVLLTDYTWTFSKALEKARSIDIGRIRAIEIDIKQLGRFGRGDVYWLLGSHALSILDMFVPLETTEFEKIDFIKNKGVVETGMILFKAHYFKHIAKKSRQSPDEVCDCIYRKEVKGRINVSLNCIEKRFEVIIYGSEGTIIYDPLIENFYQDDEETLSLSVGWYKGMFEKTAAVVIKNYSFNERHNLKYAIEHFYKTIRGKAESNIETAIEITRILENL